jgi:hypothetical protein
MLVILEGAVGESRSRVELFAAPEGPGRGAVDPTVG